MNPKEPDPTNPLNAAARRIQNDKLDDPALKAIVADTMALTERKGAEDRVRFRARLLDAVGQAIIATDPQLLERILTCGMTQRIRTWS